MKTNIGLSGLAVRVCGLRIERVMESTDCTGLLMRYDVILA